MERIKKYELCGAVLSIIIGTLLHFVFSWTGHNHFVALFGAVNESTWEHLKLAFWPTFIFAFIEWSIWGKRAKNFCLASFIKLISMPLVIVGLFYGWLAILPDSLIWNIFIFISAVIIGYVLSYKILKSDKDFGKKPLWSILILLLLIAFSVFTYFPPKNFLFRDPVLGGYGIEK